MMSWITNEEQMNYSTKKQGRMKEYRYFRYDIFKEVYKEEKIFCKNDVAFLEYLSDMNNKYKYSKFFSKKEWNQLKIVQRNMLEKYKGNNDDAA